MASDRTEIFSPPGQGVLTSTVTVTPAQLKAGADIQILPAVPGKKYVLFGAFIVLGAGAVDWTGGGFSFFSGHGDLLWFNPATGFAAAPNPATNYQVWNGSAGAAASGAVDTTGEAIFLSLIVGWAPAGADKSLIITTFYQLI